jgi:D-glycero-alpha-D-manno-heptose-7-phosphate kinase
MIIIRTPYRISFFGGGTDYPAWYREHGGCVLSTSINKCSFLVLRRLPEIFDYRYKIRYFNDEVTKSADDIQMPTIREAIKYMNFDDGLDITHHGDLPNRTGIGSSSSFTVSLIHGLATLKNQQITKRDLAKKAIYLEQNILRESVGSQDQVAAAFGGFNRIEFGGYTDFTVLSLHLKKDILQELESWVQLFFTEKLRNSFDIAEKKITNISSKKVDLNIMKELTREAENVLFEHRIYDFANLLNDQWKLKKSMESSITNTEIDDIYDKGIQAGAVGGKLLGAGGGGFILFLTPPHMQKKVAEKLKLRQVPLNFDYLGSQLIYHDYQN